MESPSEYISERCVTNCVLCISLADYYVPCERAADYSVFYSASFSLTWLADSWLMEYGRQKTTEKSRNP